MEALAYESNKTVVPAVCEIVLQSKYARGEASQRMLDLIPAGRVYTFGYIYDDWKGMQWTLQVLMSKKSKDCASHFKSNQKMADKQLQLVLKSFQKAVEGD